jgi:hypothetical protein
LGLFFFVVGALLSGATNIEGVSPLKADWIIRRFEVEPCRQCFGQQEDSREAFPVPEFHKQDIVMCSAPFASNHKGTGRVSHVLVRGSHAELV